LRPNFSIKIYLNRPRYGYAGEGETIKYKIDVLAFSLANKSITSFTSINSASIGLGISRTTLSRYINTGIPVFSSILKLNIILNSKAKLSNKNNILLLTSKLNNKFAEITGIDRYKFSTELVTAIKKDKMTIHSTYLNPFEI
jgi:NUMOD1 domain